MYILYVEGWTEGFRVEADGFETDGNFLVFRKADREVFRVVADRVIAMDLSLAP